MRYLLLLLAMLFVSPAFSQTIEESLSVAEASAPLDGPRIDRDEIALLILEANKQSKLGRFQKARIERVMTSNFRSLARERMIDRVTKNLLDAGAIEVGPEGTVAAIDIKAIIAAIEKWLPVLLQLLALFGG